MSLVKRTLPISETLLFAITLALIGGYFDGYTYALRDGRFATMETGNLILMVYRFVEGNWRDGLLFLLPISSFILGIFLVNLFAKFAKEKGPISYRQILLLIEMSLVIASSFVPLNANLNIIATSLLSFASAIQLESFRSVRYIAYASNMCTGNLQKMARGFSEMILNKDKKGLREGLCFLSIVISFLIGVLISILLGKLCYSYSILFSLFPLLFAFLSLSFKGGKDLIQSSSERG